MLRSFTLVGLVVAHLACARPAHMIADDDDDDCSNPNDVDDDCPPPPRLVAASCFTCGADEGPRATAIGGTQAVSVLDAEDNLVTGVVAELSDDTIAIEDPAGASFVLAGEALGHPAITIAADGQAPFTDSLETATLSAVSLVPSTGETTTDAVAFASGDLTVGLFTIGSAYNGYGILLADGSLAVSGWPGATQPTWDSLQGSAAVGTYTLGVTSGAVELDVPLVIVDRAEAINVEDQPILPGADAVLCFDAVNGGRDVVGLAWTFAFASQPAGATLTASGPGGPPNCVIVFVPTQSSTQVAITATAGGATITHTYAYE